MGYRDKFLQAMDDDFNTGGAIAELFELARRINKYCDDAGLESGDAPSPESLDLLTQLMTTLRELTSVLGLFCSPPAMPAAGTSELTGELMQLLIALRSTARAAKDFATADKIRDALSALGIQLEDRGGGTEWSPGQGDFAEGLMNLLIDLRKAARDNKDFATADQIRDALQDAGVTLEDRAGGTEWTVA